MTIKSSYVWAVVIALMVTFWIISGQFGSGDETENEAAETAEGLNGEDAPLAKIRAREFTAEPVLRDVVIRGRTEAIRAVEVRAETSGTVTDLPVEKGEFVAKGDVLCALALEARDAKLAEAKALMRQRWLEYDASKKLAAKGHRSETQAAAAKAAYDAAVAQAKQMEVQLNYTKMLAPFDGVVDARPVEIGDFMQVNSPCATVVDLDPLLIVGQVSERDVSKLRIGAPGEVSLLTGETIQGKVRFVAKTADEATRTFRIELEVANEDFSLRSGITAEVVVPADKVMAHRISPAFLVLNDTGDIGVRMVDTAGEVSFHEVEVVQDRPDGVWISGLPEQATIITVGQEFVRDGQRVDVTLEDEKGARS